MIKWKLAEVMARYKIKGNALAALLKVRSDAVSNLKNKDTMPKIDGDRLNQICEGLSQLAGEIIPVSDLLEYVPTKE